ncbi:MAG: PEP-CTERM sorting domain-containing protein [Acidobacteria bacterium]|nr:PEP-CTERM sorting domain-containing protein [Acidobacteriota bacterium]
MSLLLSVFRFYCHEENSCLYLGGLFRDGNHDHVRWRTTTVSRPLDADGDNRYGMDGYVLLVSPNGVVGSNPAYISLVQRFTISEFYGGNSNPFLYVPIDNLNATGTLFPGTWFSGGGTVDVFARITISTNRNFRLGVLVDFHDFNDVSPSTLRVQQIFNPTPANSGFVSSILAPNLSADWYFFDISAKAGDVLEISGQNWNQRYSGSGAFANGIGALTFDTIPEPSTYGLVGAAMAFLFAKERR